MTVAQDLATVTRNVLSFLGEPTMQALVRELKAVGISLNPDELDIKKIDTELRKIFGDGAEVFMQEIYVQFRALTSEYGQKPEPEVSENLAAYEKILKLLTIKALA
jgi:hypothetical protein